MEDKPRPRSALLCPICNNYLVNSYRLPCGHTFCFRCLNNSEKISNKLTCYSCKHKWEIPAQGIIGFDFVSSSDILKERLFSRLSHDKKDKFYSSDPNLNFSAKLSSEKYKPSQNSSKIEDDPTYQRYSRYKQPDSASYTSNISSTKFPSSFISKRRNLKQNDATTNNENENSHSRSGLSDRLSKRSFFKNNQNTRRERPQTTYEFPHHSTYSSTVKDEHHTTETDFLNPHINRSNIYAGNYRRNDTSDHSMKFPSTFTKHNNNFHYKDNSFHEIPKTEETSQNNSLTDESFKYGKNDYQSNMYHQRHELPSFKTKNFDYSNGNAHKDFKRYSHFEKQVDLANYGCNKDTIGSENKRTFKFNLLDQYNDFVSSSKLDDKTSSKASNEQESTNQNVNNSNSFDDLKAENDMDFQQNPLKPTKSSKNFLDRYNNPDLFNKRILKISMSRLRYEKIMNDENLDESLLLSEDELSDATNQKSEVLEENSENLDPNININKSKKTKSQLTDEELKVNGRSLKDVVDAARKKYSAFIVEKTDYSENDEQMESDNIENIEDVFTSTSEPQNDIEEDVKISKTKKLLETKISNELSLKWKFEKFDFSMPTSILLIQDMLVVADYGNSCLEYYDNNGNLEHRIDGFKPFSLARFSRNIEKIFVGDRKSKSVRVFDKFGTDIEQLEKMNVEWLSGIAVLSTSRICVLDRSRCKVVIAGPDGETENEFGSYGNSKQQLCMANFLAVDSKDRILVADSGNHCVKIFDSKGKFLSKFAEKGSEDGQLSWPKGITLDSDDNIIIADTNNNRISYFSPDGVFIRHLICDISFPFNLDYLQNHLAISGYSLDGTSYCSVFNMTPVA